MNSSSESSLPRSSEAVSEGAGDGKAMPEAVEDERASEANDELSDGGGELGGGGGGGGMVEAAGTRVDQLLLLAAYGDVGSLSRMCTL